METEEKNEITNFKLEYDGMYLIEWTNEGKIEKWYILLSISKLLRMLEIEGITYEQVLSSENYYRGKPTPLIFKKVKLRYELEEGRFLVYFHDAFLGNTLRENFAVELFKGDSMKNHKHETILADVKLVDEKYHDDWQKIFNQPSIK